MPQNSISPPSGQAYSETNVQEAGVDEADIVKTDGNYLYAVDGSKVHIIDVSTAEAPVKLGFIQIKQTIEEESIEENIADLYLYGNELVVRSY